jgi:hypothetical protein
MGFVLVAHSQIITVTDIETGEAIEMASLISEMPKAVQQPIIKVRPIFQPLSIQKKCDKPCGL